MAAPFISKQKMLQNNPSDRKTLKIPKLQNRTNSNYFITKIPCQDKENSVDDLVIANLDEQSIVQTPFLTFVPDKQIAEVRVKARNECARARWGIYSTMDTD